MSELRELYQEVIIDHGRRPRNFCACDAANCIKEGYNPLCGDKLTVYLVTDGDVVKDASFQGSGCAISIASASLMTEAVKGMPVDEVKQLFKAFHQLVTDKDVENDILGKLQVLAGVHEFPMRVKCATLAWHTLVAALDNSEEQVTTE